MANLIRRSPFWTSRRGDPFSELRQMQHDMDRLFNQFFDQEIAAPDLAGAWNPPAETYMKGDNLAIRSELPGVNPRDVDVSYDENSNQLVVKGERKQDKETKEEDYFYREFAYGRFERRFALPAGVKIDQLKAKFNNGVLEITVPAAAEAKPKKIQIEIGAALPEAEKGGKKAA